MSQDVSDVATDRNQAIDAARLSLNFFAALAIPEIFKYSYPSVFLGIWDMFLTGIERIKGKDYLAIGLPRGFGKTILLKLYAAYIVFFTDRQFILIICNTQALAENFLSDVADILSSTNMVALFGDWRLTLEKETLNQKKFSFRNRSITIAALGAGSSLRGLNIKYVRPDVIIMDDMQSREQAESVVESVKTITWMLGTLLKAASPDRCLYIFVGNMYPFSGSILKKLKYNNAWLSFITGAIQIDGESIWPELRSVDDLLTELENDTSLGHPEIFFSEVMNDEEAGTRSGVDISRIRSYGDSDLPESYHSGFIIIDPSMGYKTSDDVVLGVVLVYDTKPVLRELVVGKFNPKETVEKGLKLALKWGVPAVIVEGTAYQASLVFWFNYFIEMLGLRGVEAVPIHSGRQGKNSQIISALKELIADELCLHSSVKSLVTNQITHFNPLKTKNKDDILDIVRYMSKTMTTCPAAIMCPLWATPDSEQSLAAHAEDLQLNF